MADSRDVRAVWPRLPGDAHAGRTETSLLLAIAPEAVDMDRAVVGTTTPIRELLPDLQRDGLRAHSSTGILGDPTEASAEEGRRLWEVLRQQLVDVLDGS